MATVSELHHRMQFWCTEAERSRCPIVRAVREISVLHWNAYARKVARKQCDIGRSAYDGTYRTAKFSQRRNLSAYDNRRAPYIVDRYYLGIYPNDYFG